METTTLNKINEIVFHFLHSKTPEVLAIRGKWGVGKTFAWNYFLDKTRGNKHSSKANNILLDHYSYVSLFGINDLETLKRTIFENTIATEHIGKHPNIKTYAERTGELLKEFTKKSLKYLKLPEKYEEYNPIDFKSVINALPSVGISNQIICLDDIERKGEPLKIRDILGLVNHLKEERQCKIVLLLNDEEEGIEEFDKYREKVFDYEILFEPTVEDVSSIVLSQNDKFKKIKNELITKYEISNIRIVSKINTRFKNIEKLLSENEIELAEDILKSYFFFSICKLQYDPNIYPKLSYVKKGLDFFSIEFDLKSNSKQSGNKMEDVWDETIKKNGKQVLSSLDEILIQQIETGIIDYHKFEDELARKRLNVESLILKNDWLEQIQLFRYTLIGDYQESLIELNNQFQKSIKALSIEILNQYVELLEYFGEQELIRENIEHYFSQVNSDFIHREPIRRALNFLGHQLNSTIKEKCTTLLNSSKTTVSLKEALSLLHNSSSPNDEYLLEKIEIANDFEIIDEIKRLDSEKFHSVLKDFFVINDDRGYSERKKNVKMRMQKLVVKISKENKRNELVLKSIINERNHVNE